MKGLKEKEKKEREGARCCEEGKEVEMRSEEKRKKRRKEATRALVFI